MGSIIFMAIAAGVGYLIYKKFQKKKEANVPVYEAYYAEKRRQFPWLENWIKQNGNPAPIRAKEFLANKEDAGRLQIENGLTLECPSCGCPHSWVMHSRENIIESSEKETTTRSGYGKGDFADSMLEGFKQNGSTTTITYSGRSIKDFECLNCGHSEHNEYNETWHYPPAEVLEKYKQPKPAWSFPVDKQKEYDDKAEANKLNPDISAEPLTEYERKTLKEITCSSDVFTLSGNLKRSQSNILGIRLFTALLPRAEKLDMNQATLKKFRAHFYLEAGMYDETIKDCEEGLNYIRDKGTEKMLEKAKKMKG